MRKAKTVFVLFLTASWLFSSSQKPASTLQDFVTRTYFHGLPYAEAKRFGSKAIPELVLMLNDSKFESNRPNIVSMLGIIGDPAALKALKNHLYSLKGEVSYPTFISVLAVFQALGYIAQSGDKEALKLLTDWSNPNYWSQSGLNFSYGNYKGSLMGSSISSLAIQGLGISGRPEALAVLQQMSAAIDRGAASGLNSSIQSAITLNQRVRTEGSLKVFGKEGLK